MQRKCLCLSVLVALIFLVLAPTVNAQHKKLRLPTTVSLSGLSCANNLISGTASDLCTVTLNTSAPSGGFVVNLSSNNNAVVVPGSVTIPAGAKSTGFTAAVSAVTKTQSAALTATANGIAQSFALQLNAAASGVATLNVNSTNIAFGNIAVNSTSTQSLTITSTGSAALTISSINISGSGFTLSGLNAPLTLNPNQSAVVNIMFSPTTATAVTGQLTITSNSSTGGSTLVSLSGIGQAAATQVNLGWSPPTSSLDPVAGYNVYRATSGTASYQQINSSVVAQSSYVDSSIAGGQTYDYVVRSVDAAGNLSSASNTATVAIP